MPACASIWARAGEPAPEEVVGWLRQVIPWHGFGENLVCSLWPHLPSCAGSLCREAQSTQQECETKESVFGFLSLCSEITSA